MAGKARSPRTPLAYPPQTTYPSGSRPHWQQPHPRSTFLPVSPRPPSGCHPPAVDPPDADPLAVEAVLPRGSRSSKPRHTRPRSAWLVAQSPPSLPVAFLDPHALQHTPAAVGGKLPAPVHRAPFLNATHGRPRQTRLRRVAGRLRGWHRRRRVLAMAPACHGLLPGRSCSPPQAPCAGA